MFDFDVVTGPSTATPQPATAKPEPRPKTGKIAERPGNGARPVDGRRPQEINGGSGASQ